MPCTMPPRSCSSTSIGLITVPESSTHQCLRSLTNPVSGSTSTSEAWMPLVNVKPYCARRVMARDRELGLEIDRQRIGTEVGDAPELRQRRASSRSVSLLTTALSAMSSSCLSSLRIAAATSRMLERSALPGLQHRLAADARAARRPGAAAVGRDAGIAGNDADLFHRDADGARRDLREDALGALPLLGDAAHHRHHAGGLEAQRRAVLRRDARAADAVERGRGIGHLDHRREPDAAIDFPASASAACSSRSPR